MDGCDRGNPRLGSDWIEFCLMFLQCTGDRPLQGCVRLQVGYEETDAAFELIPEGCDDALVVL